MMSSIRIDRDGIKYHPEDGKVILAYDDIITTSEWPESPLLELTNGELYVVPSPTIEHQRISQRLNNILYNYAENNSLGTVLTAPVDVKLSDTDVVIPDILFIKTSRLDIIKENFIDGPPDLIVEILSTNRKRDLVEKRDMYREFEVKEYLIVDPVEEYVIYYCLNNEGEYSEMQVDLTGSLKLVSLQSLEIAVSTIFE